MITSFILLIGNIISSFMLNFIFSPHLGHIYSFLSSYLYTNIFIIFLSLSIIFACSLKLKLKFNCFPSYKNINEFIFLSILSAYFWHISFIFSAFVFGIITSFPKNSNITFDIILEY